jgi:polyribonucleotide nucleotidyltransferase
MTNTLGKEIIVEKEIHGKKITIETGKIARQAGGAAVVKCGESIVLVTACRGAEKDGDFLPLTIDYVEKTYAAGKIPGGFFKREGKLRDKETLTSRLIDRPCRPLFPEGFNHEIQVIATVLSADPEIDTDVLAVVGASAALTLSDIPFEGPIAGVRLGRVDGKLIINPAMSQMTNSDMDLIVAGTRDAIVMVEGSAQEVPEKEVLEALFYAHREMQVLIQMQLDLQAKAGKPKMEWQRASVDEKLQQTMTAFLKAKIADGIRSVDKLKRRDALKLVKEAAEAEFVKEDDENATDKKKLLERTYEDLHYKLVRDMVFDTGKRLDGRDTKTVRPISIELGILPRAHGSALFTRGETQAIVVTTLGTDQEAQRMDDIFGESTKTFMLHYNFPPFSVGETKPMRGPGRREIGHGALAERAVKAILPTDNNFKYVIRIVSEITESNGSSSMATVCGSSLSLMDAGIDIRSSVAGVAMGLMKEGSKCAILTDILGDEDHLGDMDFKVCGTAKGITALQMDIKIKGLEEALVGKALDQAREARLHILSVMNEAIAKPRTNLSKYAPKIVTIKINPDKIRDLIGPGGKMIRSITDSCGVKIEVTDDGTVSVASNDDNNLRSALNIIESLTQEATIGQTYKGIVKRITDFGAFVEILPGTDGLVHISQLSDERVKRVEDVVQEGDEVLVKVLEIDRQGKIRLSRKDAMSELRGGSELRGAESKSNSH